MDSKESSFDLNKMSKETGIPTFDIVRVLGIPNPEIDAFLRKVSSCTTFSEAVELSKNVPGDDWYLKEAALEKAVDLCTILEEAIELYKILKFRLYPDVENDLIRKITSFYGYDPGK